MSSARLNRDVHLSLVQDLLAAPGSEQGWQTFLLHLCAALDGSAASFISHDVLTGNGGISVTARTDPEALALYQQHWHSLDPWAHSPRAARLASGAVVSGEQLVGRSEVRRTLYYQDFARRYGIGQCLAGMIEVSAQAFSCLSINGDDRRRAFDATDVAMLSALMPDFQRALDLHRRLEGAHIVAAGASAAFDALPHGVMLVSPSCRILATNRVADEILRAHDGLTATRGELRGVTPSITGRVREAVKAAVAIRNGGAVSTKTTFAVTRPSGKRSLSLLVAPLPHVRTTLMHDAAVAAIIVSDPERHSAPDAAAIGILLDLTPAESRLVHGLATGLGLDEAAARCGIRRETARTYLRTIFHKTGTHRQAELVRLVLTSAFAYATD